MAKSLFSGPARLFTSPCRFSIVWLVFCFPILFTPSLLAQQNVQRIYSLTRELYFPVVTGWKASKGELERGYDPNLSEEGWESFNYQPVLGAEECWFRVELAFPEQIALQRVDSRAVWLGLDVLGEGSIYLDGKKLGSLKAGKNRLLIKRSARAGEKVKIAVNLKGTHQKVIFRNAEIQLDQWQEAVDLAAQLQMTIYTAVRLLGTDTRQKSLLLEYDPGTDLSTVPQFKRQELLGRLNVALSEVDEAAARNGDPEAFCSSVKRSFSDMTELADHLHTYTLYLVSNAHIDLAWLWRWRETIEVAHDTFKSVLDLMRQYPELVFSQSQAQLFEWVRVYYPEMFEEIKQRVREGEWEIVGGMWVEPDCNLISGESWIRQILYGKRFFKKYFGVEVKLGWNPDSFGYNWNMPLFFSKAGIKAFLTQKLLWNDTNFFPYHIFWWKGPDSSRILVYMPYLGYTNTVNPFQMVDALRQFEANTGLRNMAFMIGYGDHGGGPDKDMLEEARKLNELPVFPRVVFGAAEDYLEELPDSVKASLPEYSDELYLEYHRGTYTTQARMKKLNRELEHSLEAAEKLSSLDAVLSGSSYPDGRLELAWKKVLFNQMHDILPGSGIAAVYRDAEEQYEKAGRLARQITSRAVHGLAARINTQDGGLGDPLLVFNTLSWPRSSVAEVEGDKEVLSNYSIYDHTGKRLPSQVVEPDEDGEADLIFRAENVPATGYRVFMLRRRIHAVDKAENTLRVSERLLENAFLRVELDPVRGLITRIYDKKAAREVLAPGGVGNMIELFEDKPKNWDAWNIGYTGVSWPLDRADKLEVTETGPVRATVRIRKSFLGPTKPRRPLATSFPSSFFTQEISLYAGSPLLEVRSRFDWWEDQVLCKAAWELNLSSDTAYFEIPMAAVGRPTTRNSSWEKARFEVPGLRWADLSEKGYGASLITDSKYGYDVQGNRMRVTLLRSPAWPDPSADRGSHKFRYALLPHPGDWRSGGTVKAAAEFCSPLLVQRSVPHKGDLPFSGRSFISSAPANVVVSAFKVAEDGQGFILRCYEAHGIKTQAEITLPPGAGRAEETDLLEGGGQAVQISEQKMRFTIDPFEIKTFRIHFASNPLSLDPN